MAEPLRLLIVEDSEDDAVLIETALRRGGLVFESSRVADAESLRRALRESSWDLVITDYVLPGFGGLEVLSILDEEQPEIPAIMVSGKIGEQAAVEAMRAGARDFVAKDNLARLPHAILRELEEAASRRAKETAEAKYAVAFRCSPNSVSLTTTDEGRFVEVNEAFERITGFAREEVLGKTTLDLGIWPDPAARSEYIRKVRNEGSIRDHELSLRRRDGQTLDVLVSSEEVELPEGPALLTVVKDVTETRRARRRLELSEERFSKAFFANPNPAIITTLSDGTILEVNELLCEMAGRPRDELIGTNGIELGLWTPEHAARMSRLLEETGSVRDLEVSGHALDGTAYDLLLSAVVVEMAGEPCVLNVGVDVTERNKLQTQLLRAQRLESIGTLAGGLAHDLNNVLTPILLAIKLLRQNRPKQQERVLGILESNARRGADLIRQLLTFARGAEGRRVPVVLGHLVQDVASIVRDTFPKSIDLELRLDRDLWSVEGDPTQFHQVLLNLAVNARDAMEGAGTLRLAARNREIGGGEESPREGLAPGRYVELEVTDTGPGIPEELRRQVFDPFFTTKQPGEGTGLGLYTVETIVAGHGGSIEITDGRPDGAGSPEAPGARFRILLPVAGTREATTDRHALLGEPEGDNELVLIVDDEEAVREIAAGVLEACGYRTVPAADGRAALARFEERRSEVRAVVMDMAMPKMDGAEAIQELRRLAPDVPIIAMSGDDSSPSLDETPAGADLFLSKPLTAEDLLGALRDVLGKVEAPVEAGEREAE